MMKVMIAGGVLAMTVAMPVAAQQAGPANEPSLVSVAVTGGTLGIGPQVGLRLSDHVGVRGSATFLGINGSYSSDDADYDGKLKLESYGAMLDVYPFGGAFRVSGGARINKNHARLTATNTAISIGDGTGGDYTAAQVGTLTGRGETKKFAPALTLGWGGSNRKGFVLGFDAGVLFQGAVRVREFQATGTLANDPAFQLDLERERQSLQDDVNDYKIYPIVQASIGYRF